MKEGGRCKQKWGDLVETEYGVGGLRLKRIFPVSWVDAEIFFSLFFFGKLTDCVVWRSGRSYSLIYFLLAVNKRTTVVNYVGWSGGWNLRCFRLVKYLVMESVS